jgi:acyl-CoA thioesterase FadM
VTCATTSTRSSRRSSLWHADDDRIVVTSEIVTVAADRSSGRAVEIPADFWANVERFEGREIPISERTS